MKQVLNYYSSVTHIPESLNHPLVTEHLSLGCPVCLLWALPWLHPFHLGRGLSVPGNTQVIHCSYCSAPRTSHQSQRTDLCKELMSGSTLSWPLCSAEPIAVCRRLHSGWGWWRPQADIQCQKSPLSSMSQATTSSSFSVAPQRTFLTSRGQGAGEAKPFSSALSICCLLFFV